MTLMIHDRTCQVLKYAEEELRLHFFSICRRGRKSNAYFILTFRFVLSGMYPFDVIYTMKHDFRREKFLTRFSGTVFRANIQELSTLSDTCLLFSHIHTPPSHLFTAYDVPHTTASRRLYLHPVARAMGFKPN